MRTLDALRPTTNIGARNAEKFLNAPRPSMKPWNWNAHRTALAARYVEFAGLASSESEDPRGAAYGDADRNF